MLISLGSIRQYFIPLINTCDTDVQVMQQNSITYIYTKMQWESTGNFGNRSYTR